MIKVTVKKYVALIGGGEDQTTIVGFTDDFYDAIYLIKEIIHLGDFYEIEYWDVDNNKLLNKVYDGDLITLRPDLYCDECRMAFCRRTRMGDKAFSCQNTNQCMTCINITNLMG